MAIRAKKLYYSISEVSVLTGVDDHVLRFWETEITRLRPAKNRAGNRIYTEQDIRLVHLLKRLLWEKNYSLAATNKLLLEKPLSDWMTDLETPGPEDLRHQELESIRQELLDLERRISDWMHE
ncbi:MAG: MerR family transcriptional regulator [Bacteroidetes bacterium]|nr:MerR family transcriptional regulator [Bacteroidota bacterium]